MRSMQHLKQLSITFKGYESTSENSINVFNYHESLLKDLQPHPNLRAFSLIRFQSVDFPRWGRELTNSLPNLVKLYIVSCYGLQILPSLSKLRYLKVLKLLDLANLEYVEDSTSNSDHTAFSVSGSRIAELTFFPSLENLEIREVPNLKGWWRVANQLNDIDSSNSSHACQSSFSCLSLLAIENCPNLLSFPLCPSVQELCLTRLNEALQIKMGQDDIELVSSSTCVSKLQSDIGTHPNLRHVTLDNTDYFKSIPVERLTSMTIRLALRLQSLSEIGEVFKRCSSLRNLGIDLCVNLKSLSGGLEYLTALESLKIHAASRAFSCKENDDGSPWRSVSQTLRSLELSGLRSLDSLPKGLQYLTSLRHLKIDGCMPLNEVPEWISCFSSLQSLSLSGCTNLISLPTAMRQLTSLQRLEIMRCSELLSRRCRNPIGEDWSKIQHIPSISIS